MNNMKNKKENVVKTEEAISAHISWCLIDTFRIWILLNVMLFVLVRFRVTKGHLNFLGNIKLLPK